MLIQQVFYMYFIENRALRTDPLSYTPERALIPPLKNRVHTYEAVYQRLARECEPYFL